MRRSTAGALDLSGPHWCGRYPGDATTATLVLPWRRQVQAFILALEAGGATVSIAATLRPPERAYLMHWSWRIFHHEIRAANVPALEAVPIQWVHSTPAAGWEAARQMVRTFALVHRPALSSRHTEGLAVDMRIRWDGGIHVRDGDGELRRLSSAKGFDDNPELTQVGRSYGVIKLRGDPVHWSNDGR